MELMHNPDLWVLTFALLGTGWYGGGSSALHDHSDAISNGGLLGIGVVGTPQLRTATGSATGGNQANLSITMNDYAFFASTFDTDTLAGGITNFPAVDAGNTVGRFDLFAPAGATGVLHGARWRYLTASDNPRIWVITDASGKIVAVWCADDPTGDDITPPITMTPMPLGGRTSRLLAPDLATVPLPAGALAVADAYIMANKLKPENRLYRALQEHASDPAPAVWILTNCQLDAGGKLALSAVGQVDVATPEPAPTLSRLKQIWLGITDWFIP